MTNEFANTGDPGTTPLDMASNIGGDAPPCELSFDQSIRGLSASFWRFRKMQAALGLVEAVLREEQLPPVISFPVPVEDGGVEPAEIDISALVKALANNPDDCSKIVRYIFGPIQQYLRTESVKQLRRLAEFSASASELAQGYND